MMLDHVICLHVPWDTTLMCKERLVLLTDTRDYNEGKKIKLLNKIV